MDQFLSAVVGEVEADELSSSEEDRIYVELCVYMLLQKLLSGFVFYHISSVLNFVLIIIVRC